VQRLTTTLLALIGAVVLMLATGCTDDNDSQDQESDARQSNYDELVARQPARSMDYSPTRETMNFWVNTWSKPGKLSYVYIQNAQGEYGYFVLEGLPVSYCAMLTPNYELRGAGNNTDVSVPAPGMDGAYYSGNQCDAYYGRDATTGAYLEFTVGANQSYFLYDEPMTLPEFQSAQPLGPTQIEDGTVTTR
jgi:hypothetical protein